MSHSDEAAMINHLRKADLIADYHFVLEKLGWWTPGQRCDGPETTSGVLIVVAPCLCPKCGRELPYRYDERGRGAPIAAPHDIPPPPLDDAMAMRILREISKDYTVCVSPRYTIIHNSLGVNLGEGSAREGTREAIVRAAAGYFRGQGT